MGTRRRRKPLGAPLPQTPDDADMTPTPDDIAAALQWAERHNSDLVDLWEAKPADDEDFVDNA